MDKTPPKFAPVSTTSIVRWIRAPQETPMRVDFAGGWLDVPRFSRNDGYVVNCAISPLVSLRDWPYERNSGLGGSGAWAILEGRDGVDAEVDLGVGWQDPAVIAETGLCVWRSGPRPVLELKTTVDMLKGKMALFWTGTPHSTPDVANRKRDFDRIVAASKVARDAVWSQDFASIAEAVSLSYAVQLDEGMVPLSPVDGAIGRKYCGGGFGGYALYLFATPKSRELALSLPGFTRIEPYSTVKA
jgi:galactokinase/mevalonate kinase-like predicted kinase